MRSSKRKTRIILFTLLLVSISIMTVAFSAMSSTLNIRGTGKVYRGNWSIKFENLQRAVIDGLAQEMRAPTIKDATTIGDYAVVLKISGDSVTYNFDVHNYGSTDAVIEELNFPQKPICTGLATNNEQKLKDAELVEKNLRYTFKYSNTGENVKVGDKLLAGETRSLTLSIGYYGEDLPSDRVDISGLGITMIYSQIINNTPPTLNPDPVLMVSSTNNPYTPYLNGPINRVDIEKVKFATIDEKPSAPIGSWDVSEQQNGSIKAYYTQSQSNNGKYDVTICAEDGKVKANSDSSNLFTNLINLKEVDFTGLDMSDITNVKYMFLGCNNIENIDLQDLNTTNITNMCGMFSGCMKLTNIDTSDFDTSNVTDISSMFSLCEKLQSIDISSFNTEKVRDMSYLFSNCKSLTSIELDNLVTSNVENMANMFSGCELITNIDLTNFDTSKVTNMSGMFSGCIGLQSINVSPLRTEKVTDMSNMFNRCIGLTSIDLSNFVIAKDTTTSYLCYLCSNLQTVTLGSNIHNVGNNAFYNCTKLRQVTGSEALEEIGNGAFEYCNVLTTIPLGDELTRIGDFAFNRCEKLKNIHYSLKLKEIGRAAFQYCFALENIDLPEGLETIGQFAFNHNYGLTCTKIKIPSTVRVIGNYYYPTHMFYDCGKDNVFVEFEVPESSQYYKAVDGILYTKDGKTLVSIPRAKTFSDNTYIMPNEVEILGELCFNRNKNITRVVISDNLVIHDNATPEQIAAGYLNYGNSLAIGIYMFTNVRFYDVKDTNTRYTTGNKVIEETKEYGDHTSGGYLLTADRTTLVAMPAKCTGYQMLPKSVTTIRKNALYIWRSLAEESMNAAFTTTDGMYSGVHLRISENTVNIEDQQLRYINWLAKNTTNRAILHLEIQNNTNSKYEIVDNQFVTKQ